MTAATSTPADLSAANLLAADVRDARSRRGGTIRTAILGASGYTGAELVRLLAEHPQFEATALTADRKAGRSMAEVFPHLLHLDLPTLTAIDDVAFDAVDFVFCALPHATTQKVIAGLPSETKVVDLSADFRLEDPAAYAEWYGGEHAAPELQKDAVYGLPEVYREAIKEARLVANTGCYVATSLLAVLPLLRGRVIETDPIVIDAVSGVSGAGRGVKENLLFAEVAEGTHAYGVGRHRHVAELDQEFSKAAGVPVRASFTPHLGPFNRGIYATIYVRGEPEAVHATLAEAYANEPFVHVRAFGEAPQSRHVRGSNYVHLGVASDRADFGGGRAIVMATLDNLVKGASGQAIQNANLMMGLDETLGLTQAPLFP